MKRVSQGLRLQSFSRSATLGALLLICLSAMLVMAPAALSAPSRASYVVVLKDDVAHPAYLAHRHERNRGAEITHVYGVAIKGYSAMLTPKELKAIKKDPNVDYAESDGAIEPKGQAVGNQLKRVYANLSNLKINESDVPADRVNADIAILDTGVYPHPDLNIVARVNCVEGGGGCKPGAADDDKAGHGTHVAGDAAAIDNNIGMVGTAPGARIWSVKVINKMGHVGGPDEVGMSLAGSFDPSLDLKEGNALMSDAIAGINYVTAHSSEIEVANMSFACSTTQWGCARTALAEAIATSVNSGVVWVAAAGQEGNWVAGNDNAIPVRHYPALLSDVITVSAMADYDGLSGSLSNSNGCPLEKGSQHDDRLMGLAVDVGTDYETLGSNFGPEVDITAPGSCVFSTWSPINLQNAYNVPYGSEYGFMYGSSVASALVAGAAADIAAEFNPNNRADVEKIKNTLVGRGNYNWQDLVEKIPHDNEPVSPDGVKEPLLDMSNLSVSGPTVITNPATTIGKTTARLGSWINPNGFGTYYFYQYGTTTAYGSNYPAPAAYVGPGNSPVWLINDIGGLKPNTTYHYRVVAWNQNGTNYGGDQEFTTEASSPIVTTNPATTIGKTTARLGSWINPNGFGTYYFYQYGTTTAYGNEYPTPSAYVGPGNSPVWLINDIGGLQPNTTYHYRVVAWNESGASYGGDQQFTTEPDPPILSNMAAEPKQDETSVSLSAKVSSQSSNVSFRFECGTGGKYTLFSPEVERPIGFNSSVNAVISGFTPGVVYACRISAWNNSGVSSSPSVNVKLPAVPWVEALPPAEVTPTKIAMAGKVNGRGFATTYRFEYGTDTAYGRETTAKAVPSGSGFQTVSTAVEGLSAGETIHYRIVAASGEGVARGEDRVATTGWNTEPSSGPSGAKFDWLSDVSCPAAGSCFAAGGYADASGAYKIAAERWNGSAWTAMGPVGPTGTGAGLRGVACPSASTCLAVGYLETSATAVRPLFMNWNGSAWSEVSPASSVPSGYKNYVNDIACTSASNCEAVGFSVSTSGGELKKPLAMHWDGSAWTLRTSANPLTSGGEPSAESNVLEAVSCASATVCKAVGTHYGRVGGVNIRRPLVERLNGSEWTSEAINLSWRESEGETDFWLYGVSCPTTTACFAVGASASGHSSTYGRAFTLRWWGGSEWTTSMPPDELSVLEDVSCSSPNSCRAVGSGGEGMHWTGNGWKHEVPIKPANADPQLAKLTGVSCPTAQECHAVGITSTNSAVMQRLTEGWSGAGMTPTFKSDGASGITETTAVVHEYVNRAGVDTTYYLEYGPTVAYGSKTPETAIGSDGVDVNGNGWFWTGDVIKGLKPETYYHYRVVASNETATATSPDYTFKTAGPPPIKPDISLPLMPVTEPFSATTSAVSDFASKWSSLPWTLGGAKGTNNADGWGPVNPAFNSAYFLPKVNDQGGGLAAQATLAVNPGASGRFSLWLDMPFPISERKGYELRFQATAIGTYTVSLKKWLSNSYELTPASKTGYALPDGSTVALVDERDKVSAWVNTGTGFTKLLSAADNDFSGGNAGIEVLGPTTTRLTKFKVAPLAEKAASFEAAVSAVPIIDAFNRSESPLSSSGAWSVLNWVTAAGKTGKVESLGGWGSAEAGTLNGAYWQKATVADTGGGNMVSGTSYSTIGLGSHWSLWLNAPSPGTLKSGYELRLTEIGTNFVEVKLVKWAGGTATTLGTPKFVSFASGMVGARFALLDKGGTVSAWSSPSGGTFTQAVSAADSTYSYGYGGTEADGQARVRDFRLGQLGPY